MSRTLTTIALLSLTQTALADDFYVNSSDVDNDGSCDVLTETTDCTLTEAVLIANENPGSTDVVHLQTGIKYSLTEAWADETALPTIYSTVIIQGQGSDSIIQRPTDGSADAFRLFNVHESGRLVLSRVTIRGGHSETNGGAILNAGTLRLRNAVLEDNTAEANGGAIASTGSVFIKHSTLQYNSAEGNGGAIAIQADDHTRVRMNRSTMYANTAYNIDGTGGGGAVYMTGDANTILSETTFSGNETEGLGGAMYLFAPDTTDARLRNLTIVNNAAVEAGGIYMDASGQSAEVQLSNSIISQNSGDNPDLCVDACVAEETFTSLGGNLVENGRDAVSTHMLDLYDEVVGLMPYTVAPMPSGADEAGTGHHPITRTSNAAARGIVGSAAPRDQLGRPRTPGPVDAGSVRAVD
jgi:predicted outer membrane repeat protein